MAPRQPPTGHAWTASPAISPEKIFSAEAFEGLVNDWSQTLRDYLKVVPEGPVMRWATPADLSDLFDEEGFEDGVGSGTILRDFREKILPWCQYHAHPRVAGHMVSNPLPIAVVADLAASLLNQGMGIWEVSPGPVMLTQQVIDWLTRAAKFGSQADGILTSGGTEANLTAILAARSHALGPQCIEEGVRDPESTLIFTSELAHYSIGRAAGMTGLGRRQVVPIPVDERLCMSVDRLETALESALGARKRVLCVVATAGTTSAGTFDPIEAIADLCARFGVWLHVDGCHGASLLLSEKSRHLLAGVERARSLAWDPHKMLFVPSSLGTLLVADGRDLQAIFDDHPHYLFRPQAQDDPRWNFTLKNFRCTQRFDALRLWAVLRFHGRRELGVLIDRTTEVAHYLWARIAEEPDFEPVVEPPFNIVCFRHLPSPRRDSAAELDHHQEAVRAKLLRDGSAWITTTVVHGRVRLRVAVMNPTTTEADMDALVELVREAGGVQRQR